MEQRAQSRVLPISKAQNYLLDNNYTLRVALGSAAFVVYRRKKSFNSRFAGNQGHINVPKNII